MGCRKRFLKGRSRVPASCAEERAGLSPGWQRQRLPPAWGASITQVGAWLHMGVTLHDCKPRARSRDVKWLDQVVQRPSGQAAER